MARQIDNVFTTYEFEEEELISAATFTDMQRLYLQTQRALAATDLLSLEFYGEKPLEFVKAQSYQQGLIAAFDFLLDHENLKDAKERWEALKAAAGNTK